ncbi:hypothetical protein ACWD69_09450 [Micromonospora chokoriensis]
MICRHCGTTLDARNQCPGEAPLLRDHWGTAAQIAHRRGSDITAARVRDWARRSRKPSDPLYGMITAKHHPGRGRGTTLYDDREMSRVERTTRVNVEEHGGPSRGPRAELTPAGT